MDGWQGYDTILCGLQVYVFSVMRRIEKLSHGIPFGA